MWLSFKYNKSWYELEKIDTDIYVSVESIEYWENWLLIIAKGVDITQSYQNQAKIQKIKGK